MELSAHKKFINALRSPMKKYNRITREKQRQKTGPPYVSASTSEMENDLMRELEAKFDELFGPLDDES